MHTNLILNLIATWTNVLVCRITFRLNLLNACRACNIKKCLQRSGRCHNLLNGVALDQVSTIKRESSKYKEYIKRCKLRKKDEVEEYLQNLRTKSDGIEESRLKCEQLLRNQHVTEIVKQKKQRISELEEAKRPDYFGCEFNIKYITGISNLNPNLLLFCWHK